MTTDRKPECNRLEKIFDVLLDQNRRLRQENELLRTELERHPAGALQIRSIERSLASAWRHCESEAAAGACDG